MLTDSRVTRLLVIALILFLGSVVLQINGSSIAVWKDALRDNASPSGLVFSTAKSVRSDEWMAWTPSILSQALHRPAFPVQNPNLGAGKSPLLMSVPVRHYSMLFRPQLWGFFIFNIETAFAFYWNVKVFALLISFFLLLLALTEGKFWISLFGVTWVFFSAFIQWWFSCPPMMPEMLASWAIALLCVIQLFRNVSLSTRVVLLVVLVIAAVNFGLCFYPPFQIPLAYLGLAVIAGWLWQNRTASLRWRGGFFGLAIAAVGMAVVLVPYLYECKPTLELVANTAYPGARRTHGGQLSINDTFNGVLGFFNSSERDYLRTRENACEASNFYPLWLFVLVGGGWGILRDRTNRRTELMLAGCLALFTLYAFCPLPAWFCRYTLLSFVTGTRVVLAIGIAGILLTTLYIANPIPIPQRSRYVSSIVCFLAVVFVLLAARTGNAAFLNTWRSAALLALNLSLIGLYFFAPSKIFCPAFLLALILNNGSVNPVATGLGPLLEATPASTVREIVKTDPDGKWATFSNAWLPQFLKAQGADVLNGLSIVPDLDLCRQLDPSRKYESIYNRYAFMILERGDDAQKPEFHPLNPSAYVVGLSATDPVLLSRGLRYVVVPRALNTGEATGMQLLASLPTNRIWIYRLLSDSERKSGIAE